MYNIVVIEDEQGVRTNILALLKAEGFIGIGAENGEVGLQVVRREQPDLIICDIMMPELDGYQILAELQQDPQTALIPFIFLTAKTEWQDFRQGMTLGADDYIVKPFDTDELLDAIKVKLKKKELLSQQIELLGSELNRIKQLLSAKDEILENFNQELRRPLSNIKLALEMLEGEGDDPHRERYLEVLRSEFEREITLLNQIAELQKLLTPDNIHLLSQFNLLHKHH